MNTGVGGGSISGPAPRHQDSSSVVAGVADFTQLSLPWGEEAGQEIADAIIHDDLGADFFRPRSRREDPQFLHLVDAMYAGALYALALRGEPPEEITARRDDLISFYRAAADIPMLKVYGSARDPVWHPALELFTDELARLSVERGISLGNGGGATGAMGRTIHAWERHLEGKKDPVAKIVCVPLQFLEETFEARIEGVNAMMAPGTPALPIRTSLLHVVGNTLGSLYYPGGFGTIEELFVDLVGRQLSRPIHTVHSHRESLGAIWLVSPEIVEGRGGWYEGLRQFLEGSQAGGAVSHPDLARVKLLTLEDPQADARLVVKDALVCRDTTGCHFG